MPALHFDYDCWKEATRLKASSHATPLACIARPTSLALGRLTGRPAPVLVSPPKWVEDAAALLLQAGASGMGCDFGLGVEQRLGHDAVAKRDHLLGLLVRA